MLHDKIKMSQFDIFKQNAHRNTLLVLFLL